MTKLRPDTEPPSTGGDEDRRTAAAAIAPARAPEQAPAPAPAPAPTPESRSGAIAFLVRHRVAILLGYVAVSALGLVFEEIPDRPYLLFWLLALLFLACAGSPRHWMRVMIDWLPVLVIAAGYDLVRSTATDLTPRAITMPQMRFDELLFFGTAPTVRLQRALVDGSTPHWWDYPAWLTYLSHFFVTPAIALWLYLRHREWFHRYAILILTVSLCGFVTYFLVPAVPPWLASRHGDLAPTTRIVHAVWQSLGVPQVARVFNGNPRLANPVAALPSLHAAWPFMTLLFLWRKVGRWHWLLLAYNALMVTVLVYGAEHYVSDILMGWVYATVVYLVVTRLLDRRDRRLVAASTS